MVALAVLAYGVFGEAVVVDIVAPGGHACHARAPGGSQPQRALLPSPPVDAAAAGTGLVDRAAAIVHGPVDYVCQFTLGTASGVFLHCRAAAPAGRRRWGLMGGIPRSRLLLPSQGAHHGLFLPLGPARDDHDTQ